MRKNEHVPFLTFSTNAIPTILVKNGEIKISAEILKRAGLEEKEISLIINKHTILLKPKSFSKKIRGIIKNTNLSMQELEDLYNESRL